MPVLMIGESDNLDAQTYASMIAALSPAMRAASGFIFHAAQVKEDGQLRVLEVWQSKAESDAFFAQCVAPNLPPGIRPKRKTFELPSLVLRPDFEALLG